MSGCWFVSAKFLLAGAEVCQVLKNVLRSWAWAALFVGTAFAGPTEARPAGAEPLPLIIQQVNVGLRDLVFSYAGDLWVVARTGGTAQQLTSGSEDDTDPVISPDGTQVAFSRGTSGGADVYIVPISGAEAPKRLTFHPASDIVRDWSADGRYILFSSSRGARWNRNLYTVPAVGGTNTPLPFPAGASGIFGPGGQIILSPNDPVNVYLNSWRGYRGGLNSQLVLADPATGKQADLSNGTANDRSPTLAGDRLVIASDRDGGVFNLYSLDRETRAATPLTRFRDYSVGAVDGAPDGLIVFVRDGRFYATEGDGGAVRSLDIRVIADPVERRARRVAAADWIVGGSVSPDGRLVAFNSRGDILLLDRNAASIRNLTRSSGANDRNPIFGPDGRSIAYVSDAAGEDGLYVQRLDRAGSIQRIELPPERSAYSELSWSPDGRRIALSDGRGALWIVDMATRKTLQVDKSRTITQPAYLPSWSPDGQWLAYVNRFANNHGVVFLYDVREGIAHQITSDLADVSQSAFGPGGSALFFLTSSNAALAASSMYSALLNPAVTRELRGIALRAGTLSPFAPPAAAPSAGAPLVTQVDLNGLDRRIWTAPIERRDYRNLIATMDGGLVLSVREWPSTPGVGGQAAEALYLYRPGSKDKPVRLLDRFDQLAASGTASIALIQQEDQWGLLALADTGKIAPLDLSAATLMVDPAAEWRQIYRDAWRYARDDFYDPVYHGQDIAALERHYAAFLPGIARRVDLTALLYASLGTLSVSHLYLSGGDLPKPPEAPPAAGLLGVDVVPSGARYRVTRIHRSDPLASVADEGRNPFDMADARLAEGEYLLAVDDEEVLALRDLDSYLLGSAGRPVRLKVGQSADGRGSRTITVVPLKSEAALREAEWIDRNRRAVTERSKGALAYVYIPDYLEYGVNAFLRDLAGATDKRGIVVDQRYNRGGWLPDLMLDFLIRRSWLNYQFRDAPVLEVPILSNNGPKALLVNERNGSAAETFAWAFRRSGIGPLIGKRTAGYGIGHWYTETLIDGGELVVPMRRFFDPRGGEEVENHGVSPDIEVEQDPALVAAGRDPQLEAAIESVLKRLPAEAGEPQPKPFGYPPIPQSR